MTSDLPPTGGSAPGHGTSPSGTGSQTPPPPPTPPTTPPPPNPPNPPNPGQQPGFPPPPAGAGTVGAPFFDNLRRMGVYRPDGGRWFAGVAAGISRRWGVDPLLVRGIFVALTILGGVGLLLYGLAWLFLPQDDGRIHAQQVLTGDVTAGFFGGVVFTLLGIGGDGGPGPWGWGGWGFPGGLLLTVLIVGGIIYWASRHQGRPGAGPGAGPGTGPGQPYTPQPYTPQPYTPQPYTPQPYTSQSYAPQPYTSQPYTSQPYPPQPFGQSNPTYPSSSTPPPAGPGETRAEAPTTTLPAPPPATLPYGSPPPPGSNAGGYPYPPADRPSRREASAPLKRVTRAAFGLALLAGVGGFLIAGTGSYDTGEQVLIGMTCALAVVALGVIVSGVIGRRSAGLAGIGVLLAVVTLLGTAAHSEGISQDQSFVVAGERFWTPVSTGEADDGISQGVGELTVDLTGPALYGDPNGRLTVPVRMGAGRIVLIVPDSVPAEVRVDQGGGQVTDVTGDIQETGGGAGNHQVVYRTGPDGAARLIVRVRQGAGEIEMRSQALGSSTPGTEPSSQPSSQPGSQPGSQPSTGPGATPSATASATPTPTGATQ